MRWFVKTVRSVGLCAIALSWTTAEAHAIPVDERELSRWVPAITLGVGLNAQRAEGHVGTSDVLGPPVDMGAPPGFNVQPIVPGTPATERERMMTPFAGIGVELSTPAWTALPLRPRAFAHADVSVAFGPSYNAPSVGDLGPLRPSESVGGQTEATILGQGAQTTLEVRPLLFNAGVGVAFTTEVSGRALRIKPSAEYLRYEVEVTGLAQRAVRPLGATPQFSDFRQIVLGGSETFVFHSVGAGLEAELDTGRAGPFVMSLFGGFRSWAVMNDEKRNVFVGNQYGETASFTYLGNKWLFGGALGVRFRWVPE